MPHDPLSKLLERLMPFQRTDHGVAVRIDMLAMGIDNVLADYEALVRNPPREVYGTLRPALSEDPFDELEHGEDDDATIEHMLEPIDVARATLASEVLDAEAFDAWLSVTGNGHRLFEQLSQSDSRYEGHARACRAIYAGLAHTLYPESDGLG